MRGNDPPQAVASLLCSDRHSAATAEIVGLLRLIEEATHFEAAMLVLLGVTEEGKAMLLSVGVQEDEESAGR
jgi:hypothetical protein